VPGGSVVQPKQVQNQNSRIPKYEETFSDEDITKLKSRNFKIEKKSAMKKMGDVVFTIQKDGETYFLTRSDQVPIDFNPEKQSIPSEVLTFGNLDRAISYVMGSGSMKSDMERSSGMGGTLPKF
jgi:hypothetical protein